MSLTSGNLPRCRYRNPDCFARTATGRCLCLSDTRFLNNICPFYKSMNAHISDVRKAERRLYQKCRVENV